LVTPGTTACQGADFSLPAAVYAISQLGIPAAFFFPENPQQYSKEYQESDRDSGNN